MGIAIIETSPKVTENHHRYQQVDLSTRPWRVPEIIIDAARRVVIAIAKFTATSLFHIFKAVKNSAQTEKFQQVMLPDPAEPRPGDCRYEIYPEIEPHISLSDCDPVYHYVIIIISIRHEKL
jgi:hypothetical protein